MKKSAFIKYLLSVVVGVIIIDVIVRLIFTPIFSNLPEGTKAASTYKFVVYKKPANIVILGASAANHQYVSTMIEDSLNMSCYNYGRNGRCIFYQYLCLLRALENTGVKLVILDMGKALLCNEWTVDRISDLYPYYWNNDTVKNMIKEVKGDYIDLLMCSSMIQYNSQYLNLVTPIHDIKGFTPLPYKGIPVSINNEGKEYTKENQRYELNPVALKYFGRLVKVCKKNNLRLVVCFSPRFVDMTIENEGLKSLCEQYHVEYWDMAQLIKDPLLFNDVSHLNEKGAKLFTNEIIRKIKEIGL